MSMCRAGVMSRSMNRSKIRSMVRVAVGALVALAAPQATLGQVHNLTQATSHATIQGVVLVGRDPVAGVVDLDEAIVVVEQELLRREPGHDGLDPIPVLVVLPLTRGRIGVLVHEEVGGRAWHTSTLNVPKLLLKYDTIAVGRMPLSNGGQH